MQNYKGRIIGNCYVCGFRKYTFLTGYQCINPKTDEKCKRVVLREGTESDTGKSRYFPHWCPLGVVT